MDTFFPPVLFTSCGCTPFLATLTTFWRCRSFPVWWTSAFSSSSCIFIRLTPVDTYLSLGVDVRTAVAGICVWYGVTFLFLPISRFAVSVPAVSILSIDATYSTQIVNQSMTWTLTRRASCISASFVPSYGMSMAFFCCYSWPEFIICTPSQPDCVLSVIVSML